MRCRKARARIQDWFDTPGLPGIPADVQDHVRVCPECRALITRWNAVELRLQAMRQQTPTLSPDFALSLQARLRAEAVGVRRPMLNRYWPVALAGVSLMALIALLVLRLLGSPSTPDFETQSGAPNLAVSQPAR